MNTKPVKVLAKSIDYGIHKVATEHTKLLSQSFDYGSRNWRSSNINSKECILEMPLQSVESLYRKKTALTLDELVHYQNDPVWKCIRRTLMISFWLMLIAIFAAACIIVFLEDKQNCAINSAQSITTTTTAAATAGAAAATNVITPSDGVLNSTNLSNAPTLLIDSIAKTFFNTNKSAIVQ